MNFQLLLKLIYIKRLLITFMYLFTSGCAFTHFKIKLDESSDLQFSKKIISTDNPVKTTPVEFAQPYNDTFLSSPMLSTPIANVAIEQPQNLLFNKTLVKQASEVDANQSVPKSNSYVKRTVSQQINEERIEYVNPMVKRSKIKSIKSSINTTTQSKDVVSFEASQDDNTAALKPSSRYVVKKGDTLMKISFAQYGSVYKWKKIMHDNKDKVIDYSKLQPGTELSIAGDTYIVVERNGHPYLIKKNDTLMRISGKIYGDVKKWPLLWNNNKQLIQDPNKIYAGLTLYYLDFGDMKIKKADLKSEENNRKPTSN